MPKETVTAQIPEKLKRKAKVKSICTGTDITEVLIESLEDWTEDVQLEKDSNGKVTGVEMRLNE